MCKKVKAVSSDKKLEFFKNKILEQLKELKDEIPEMRWNLWVSSVEMCDDYEALREMAELDMQLDMFEYTRNEINPKLEKLNVSIQDVREGKPLNDLNKIDDEYSNKRVEGGATPSVAPASIEEYETDQILEDLDDPEVGAAMASLLLTRLASLPPEELNREELLDSVNDGRGPSLSDLDEMDDLDGFEDIDDTHDDSESEEEVPEASEEDPFADFADIETDVSRKLHNTGESDGLDSINIDDLGVDLEDEDSDSDSLDSDLDNFLGDEDSFDDEEDSLDSELEGFADDEVSDEVSDGITVDDIFGPDVSDLVPSENDGEDSDNGITVDDIFDSDMSDFISDADDGEDSDNGITVDDIFDSDMSDFISDADNNGDNQDEDGTDFDPFDNDMNDLVSDDEEDEDDTDGDEGDLDSALEGFFDDADDEEGNEEDNEDGLDNLDGLDDEDFGDISDFDPFSPDKDPASFDDLANASSILDSDNDEDFNSLLGDDDDDTDDTEDSENNLDSLDGLDDGDFGDLDDSNDEEQGQEDDFGDLSDLADSIDIEDDSDDFFSSNNNNKQSQSSQRQSQRPQQPAKREITRSTVFINGSANGQKTQDMFNKITKVGSLFSKMSKQAAKQASKTVNNGMHRINNSSMFQLDLADDDTIEGF